MPLGVYVHVPFCASRCDYCDFATWTDRGHLVDRYVDACLTDIGRHFDGSLPPATSVFFGGGTPSLLPADSLVRLVAAIPRTAAAEVTVECNPDSVDPDKLARYRGAGVDRLSLGVQSMAPHVLSELGRTHDAEAVRHAVAWARDAGFDRCNVDLIFGARGESIADWRRSLDAVLALEPSHVSAYALTVVPSTPLGRRVAAGATVPPDDDEQAAKYEEADERLGAAGLRNYEVSNWARPGDECRHNLLYWSQGDYVAIGCAAHGHRRGRRWWNVRAPERYIAAVEGGSSPRAGEERLDRSTRDEERFALALRTRTGARVSPGASGVVEELVVAGVATRALDRITLTRMGRLLADDVTARLLAAGGAGTR